MKNKLHFHILVSAARNGLEMVNFDVFSPLTIAVVAIIVTPRIIYMLAMAYVMVKRVNFETRKKRPPRKQ